MTAEIAEIAEAGRSLVEGVSGSLFFGLWFFGAGEGHGAFVAVPVEADVEGGGGDGAVDFVGAEVFWQGHFVVEGEFAFGGEFGFYGVGVVAEF